MENSKKRKIFSTPTKKEEITLVDRYNDIIKNIKEQKEDKNKNTQKIIYLYKKMIPALCENKERYNDLRLDVNTIISIL